MNFESIYKSPSAYSYLYVVDRRVAVTAQFKTSRKEENYDCFTKSVLADNGNKKA